MFSTLVVLFCKGIVALMVLSVVAALILRCLGSGRAKQAASSGAADRKGGGARPHAPMKPDRPPLAKPQPGLTMEAWDPVGPLKSGPFKDEVLRSSEIGMGGPAEETWMLRDGAIFEHISSGWYELGQARYRAAEADVRGHRHWVLYDSQSHIVYRFDSPNAMEHIRRLRLAEEDASKRGVSNPELQALLRGQQGEALDSFRGLWLEWKRCPRQRSDTLRSDALKRHQLTAHLLLPDDLRLTQRPLDLLRSPPYEIHLDGAPTGRYTTSLDAVSATPDESIVAVKGFIPTDSVWHIFNGSHWHAICGHVTRPYTGGGSYTPYDLTAVTAIEKDRIEFALGVFRINPSNPPLEIPEQVELRTSYAPQAIHLHTGNNRLVVPLPSA